MTPRTVTFTVYGDPQPKGSAKAFVPPAWAKRAARQGTTPRAIVTSDNPRGKDWQHAIASAAQATAPAGLFTGGVAVWIAFHLKRPTVVPKDRRGHHTTRPDVDKLARCVLDGLIGVLLADDGQVVELVARKAYAPAGAAPAATITIAEAAPLEASTPGRARTATATLFGDTGARP